MARNRGAHLVELAHVFAGTPIASAWAMKGAATRRARAAQLALPMCAPIAAGPAAEQIGVGLRADASPGGDDDAG